MEDLGRSHATVKRLAEKLEDMQRMFQEEKCFFHKLEGNPREVGERCAALEDRMERLNKQHGMLEVQLRTLQISIEPTTTPVELEMPLPGFVAQSEEEQLAAGRQNQHLDTAISELQAQVLVNDACSALEVPWKVKHSEESLTEQFEEIHGRSPRRCLTSETCVGCGCVPQLVGSRADGPHTHMKTLQQALMERRSIADIRKPLPS